MSLGGSAMNTPRCMRQLTLCVAAEHSEQFVVRSLDWIGHIWLWDDASPSSPGLAKASQAGPKGREKIATTLSKAFPRQVGTILRLIWVWVCVAVTASLPHKKNTQINLSTAPATQKNTQINLSTVPATQKNTQINLSTKNPPRWHDVRCKQHTETLPAAGLQAAQLESRWSGCRQLPRCHLSKGC